VTIAAILSETVTKFNGVIGSLTFVVHLDHVNQAYRGRAQPLAPDLEQGF
jgi:hypothetical protein